MKILKYALVVMTMLSMNSCINYIDNYDEPNAGVEGVIEDAETGEAIPLNPAGGNGLIVRLTEIEPIEATQSNDFRADLDGTFTHRMLFEGKYTITTVDGPFVEQPEEVIKLKGVTKVTLKAVPYSRLKVNSSSANGRVFTLDYTVTPSSSDINVTNVYGYWNYSPACGDGGSNQAGWMELKNEDGTPQLNGSAVFDLTNNGTLEENLYKVKANGGKLYFRVAAKVNGRLNYSTVQTLTLDI